MAPDEAEVVLHDVTIGVGVEGDDGAEWLADLVVIKNGRMFCQLVPIIVIFVFSISISVSI